MDIYPPAKQRLALLKFVEALGCWDRALRRDECSDWRIIGNLGHIHAVPGTLDRPDAEGFLIYFRGAAGFEEPTTSQAWTWAKKALEPFCTVTQDGDQEGTLFLDRPPAPDEAKAIREKLSIRKRTEYTDEALDRKREQMSKMSERLARKPASGESPGG